MIRTIREWLYRLGVPEPWAVDPNKVSLATVRAQVRYLDTRGVEQVASRWPWPTSGATD